MSLTQRIDVLDMVIEVLLEQEKALSDMVYRLEVLLSKQAHPSDTFKSEFNRD